MNMRPATSPRPPPAALSNASTTIPMPSVTLSPGTGALSVSQHHHLPQRLGSHNVLPSQTSMGTLYISPASTPASTPQTTPSQGPTSNTSPFVGPGGAAGSGSGSLRYINNTVGTTPPNTYNTTVPRGGGTAGGSVSPMSSSLHPLLPPSTASLQATNNTGRPRSPAMSLTSETNNNNNNDSPQQAEEGNNNNDEST